MSVINTSPGETVELGVDLATLGTIDQVTFEVYTYPKKETKLKYRYPAAVGYGTVTKTDDFYEFTVEIADNMLGQYGIVMEWIKGTSKKRLKCTSQPTICSSKDPQ